MNKKSILVLLSLIVSMNYVYAFDFTTEAQFDFPTNDLGDLDDVIITSPLFSQIILYNESSNTWFNSYLNDSAHHVNASDYWITDIGSLGTVNATQHSNNGGVLNIKESWISSLWCALTGCTMTGDIDMSDNDIIDIGNLDVNENITVGGQINITGNIIIQDRLYVGLDPSGGQSVINPGDVGIGGNLILASGGIVVLPSQYGLSAAFFNNGADDENESIFYLNLSGELNTSEELFCDYLNNPFNDSNKRDAITTVFSSEFSTSNIYLAINTIVNSSCVTVATQIFGNDNVPELTNVSYVLSHQPVFGVTDNDLVINGIRMFYETNESLFTFGSYTRQNTLQDKPGGNLFADAFTNTDGELEYVFGTQTGLNDSGSFVRNSFGIWSTRSYTLSQKQNLSFLHNMEDRWEFINITPSLDYFSSLTGADLAVEHGIESQQLFLHDELSNGLLSVEGSVNFILRNNNISFDEEDLDIIGPIHLRQPRIEEVGVNAGDELVRVIATFELGILSPFTLITSGKGADEWDAVSEANCPPDGDFCAHAGPSGGSGDTIMQDNFTTENTQDMQLTFNLNTDSFSVAGNFTVNIDNNEGTSETLYSLTGSDVSDIVVDVSIPSAYENKTLVTLDFIFSSSNPALGDVWVDTIKLNGTANVSTLVNETRLDSLIKFGEADINSTTGLPPNGIYYNDSSQTTHILGNVSASDRIFLGNGASIGYNSTCQMIFYDSAGGIMSTLGCT